ncbi:MAG: ABC transporter substrate-binding protein, partial [Candidatus Binatia bacterium]
VAPGNEAQLAQFLSQKEIDAGVLRSVTLAQIEEIKPRRLASVVDEWKKLTKSDAPPILAVTIVYNDYLAKNQEPTAKFIAATRNALQFGSKNKGRVAEILQKAANMNATDARAYANQWYGAYIASFEPADINSLKKMYDIVKAAGGAIKDPPESAFDTGPYMQAKKMK